MGNTKSYLAIVEKLVQGRHGDYVVTRTGELGVVTFALDGKAWREEDRPDPGDRVVLSRIISHVSKGRAKWRAKEVRAFNPSDESVNK